MNVARDTVSLVIAIALIVFGVLLILGEFAIQSLLPFLGILLIILGILILVKVVNGSMLIAIVAIVVGIVLLEDLVPFSKDLRETLAPVMRVINIIAGVILVVLGIQRLQGSR